MKRSTIVMAKVPKAGSVKTRLQAVLHADDCADLSAALLGDAIEKAAKLQGDLIIAYAPRERRDYFDRFSQHKLLFTAQNGADLGEKMLNAFRFAFSRGLDSVVMIGTDSPTLPAGFLEQAFDHLESGSDAVLGKTEDGGFYLIGLRLLKGAIFEGVNWSSAEAFEQTARNIKSLGLSLSLLPEWYDVDLPTDLERLRNELAANPGLAPRTAEWMFGVPRLRL